MDLSAIICTTLSCLDENKVTISKYVRGITAYNSVKQIRLRLIQKIWDLSQEYCTPLGFLLLQNRGIGGSSVPVLQGQPRGPSAGP